MKPAHRLTQPVVSRLGRTGFLFLGSIALSSAHAQSVPVQQPPPGTSPPVTQDPAQQPTAVTPPTTPPARPAEVPAAVPANTPDASSIHFVTELRRLARRGWEMSELARERASRAAVRELAAQVAATQRNIDRTLSALGTEWELRLRNSNYAQREMRQLSQAHGGAFDDAYLSFIIDDYERALELVGEMEDGEVNPRIRSFLDDHADTLREHLRHAQQLSTRARP